MKKKPDEFRTGDWLRGSLEPGNRIRIEGIGSTNGVLLEIVTEFGSLWLPRDVAYEYELA